MQPIIQMILQRKSEASDEGSKTPANGTPIPYVLFRIVPVKMFCSEK